MTERKPKIFLSSLSGRRAGIAVMMPGSSAVVEAAVLLEEPDAATAGVAE